MVYIDKLFAGPGFIDGIATTLDIGGPLNMYNDSESPEKADAKALASDWYTIGCDIRSAMNDIEEENSDYHR